MRCYEAGRKSDISAAQTADTGTVSIGGASPVVCLGAECVKALPLSASGAVRIPTEGEEMAVLRLSDGTALALGTPVYTVPEGLQNGDIYIGTETSHIKICKTGGIEISGEVRINGSLVLNGGTVNGT